MPHEVRVEQTLSRAARRACCSVDNGLLSVEEKVFETHMSDLKWHTCDMCQKVTMTNNPKTCGKNCWQFTARNNMDPGPVPQELAHLTFLEQQLIARVHPVLSVYRLRGQQIGYSGHVINFPQEIKEFARSLPHRVRDLTSIIAVRARNQAQADNNEHYHDFHVRAGVVRRALQWLRANNPFYSDIILSEENLALLPDDGSVYRDLPSILTDGSLINNDEETSECQVHEQLILIVVYTTILICTVFCHK
jgi:hypothetical protein